MREFRIDVTTPREGTVWIADRRSSSAFANSSASASTTCWRWFGRTATTCAAGRSRPTFARILLRSREAGGGNSFTGEQAASALTDRSSTDTEFGRSAGEPEHGQQREATGLLLEAGMAGLQKATRRTGSDLTPEESLGLECVLLLYGRPAVPLTNGSLASPPPLWNMLEDQREDVEAAQRGVGRIELLGHPEYDWAGTGFLVSDRVLMTTRRNAELFIEQRSDNWQFRPGISTWMNYRSTFQDVASANYRVPQACWAFTTATTWRCWKWSGRRATAAHRRRWCWPIRRGAARRPAGVPDRLSDPRRPAQRAGDGGADLPRRVQRQARPAGPAARRIDLS